MTVDSSSSRGSRKENKIDNGANNKLLKKENVSDSEIYKEAKPLKAKRICRARTKIIPDEILEEENSEKEPETKSESEFGSDEDIIPEEEEVIVEEEEDIVEENDDFILELNEYWPKHLKMENQPTNPNLLYLYSYPVDYGYNCRKCNKHHQATYSELEQGFRYATKKEYAYVTFNEHPSAIANFCEKNFQGDKYEILVTKALRPICSCAPEKRSENWHMVDGDIVNFFPCLKFYYKNKTVFVYLDISPENLPAISENLNYVFGLDGLEDAYMNGFGKPDNSETILDTFDYSEAVIPKGFKMKLRNYQLRSISWMKSVEAIKTNDSNSINNNHILHDETTRIKFKLGHSPLSLSLLTNREFQNKNNNNNSSTTKSTENAKPKPLRFRGGILADDTGSGKTVTTLGFIHSSPLTPQKQIKRNEIFKDLNNKFMESRASCVICPSNIQGQWISEALKCNPKFKVIGLSTILDLRKVSWIDVMKADIVVVSHQFLINSNYQKVKKEFYSIADETKNFLSTKGRVVIEKVHFHRIFYDEFHEILAAPKQQFKDHMLQFSADNIWGLTGTPGERNIRSLTELIPFFKLKSRFGCIFRENVFGRKEFLEKFFKRNVPNLQLPPLINETEWVNFSQNEMALFEWMSEKADDRAKIMMCCHYQLSEKLPNESFVTIEEVQNSMCKLKKRELIFIERKIEYEEEQLKSLQQKEIDLKIELEILDLEDKKRKTAIQIDLVSIASTIKSLINSLADNNSKFRVAQIKFNYFQSVFNVLGEPDANKCAICQGMISAQSLSILPCSHVFCFDCVSKAIESSLKCPVCSDPLQDKNQIIRFRHEPEVTSTSDESPKLAALSPSKYGSKLIQLYRYVTNLIDNDHNARIILFLQYKDLADFIAETLKELGIDYVRVVGNIFQRKNAISRFCNSKDIRLIMLSSEDSVSGINLTQATHVILLHPFCSQGDEVDLAFEKQGISRAYRFGLNHPLKVVRFAVRGTIEEAITLRRQNITL